MHFYAFYGLNTTAVEDTSLFIIPFYIHIKPAIKLIVQQIKPWIFCMLISKNITSKENIDQLYIVLNYAKLWNWNCTLISLK